MCAYTCVHACACSTHVHMHPARTHAYACALAHAFTHPGKAASQATKGFVASRAGVSQYAQTDMQACRQTGRQAGRNPVAGMLHGVWWPTMSACCAHGVYGEDAMVCVQRSTTANLATGPKNTMAPRTQHMHTRAHVHARTRTCTSVRAHTCAHIHDRSVVTGLGVCAVPLAQKRECTSTVQLSGGRRQLRKDEARSPRTVQPPEEQCSPQPPNNSAARSPRTTVQHPVVRGLRAALLFGGCTVVRGLRAALFGGCTVQGLRAALLFGGCVLHCCSGAGWSVPRCRCQ